MKKEEVERIFDRAKHEVERAKHEALALLCSEPSQAVDQPLPEWMNKEELANYWGMKSTSGIVSWTKRSEFPLPHGYMGDMLRFPRKECDQWAREEADRNRNNPAKTPTKDNTRRRGLSAVASPQGGQ